MAEEQEPDGITSSFLSVRTGLKNYLMRYLVRRQDVEDIVQETYLRAYESQRRQSIEYPKSFLFTVAKNIALSEIDRKAYQLMTYVSDIQDLNIADRQSVEHDVDVEQRLTALLKVVSGLPPQCQRVVVMKKVFGFSHGEIGSRLNISDRTVEKHLAKALQRCQESLQEPEETPTVEVEVPVPRPQKMHAVRGRRD